jgi:hypothetical protein
MRTEDGVFCDIGKGEKHPCRKQATYIHSCKIEGSEFAFCHTHEREWKAQTAHQPNYQVRCPRCLPQFMQQAENQLSRASSGTSLPDPITGALADAIDAAMYREGILTPVRTNVLRRLAATDSSYVRAIFRSTQAVKEQIGNPAGIGA